MQLYNEEVNDLLAPENNKLQIHESKEAGVYVAGLQEDIVTSPEHVLQLLEEGERSRHVGETRMNKNSSRSHTVFRMVRCLLPTDFRQGSCLGRSALLRPGWLSALSAMTAKACCGSFIGRTKHLLAAKSQAP